MPDLPSKSKYPWDEWMDGSVWELTQWEREEVYHGGNVELNIFAEPIPPVSLSVTGEGVTWGVAVIFAARYVGDDGRWYIRLSFRDGVRLAESKGYGNRWGAWLAQRRLKKILPSLEMWPT